MSRILLFKQLPFDQLSKKALFEQLLAWMNEKAKKVRFLLNMNAFGVVTYLNKLDYRQLIDGADLIISDGWGPVLASRLTAPQKLALQSRLNVGDILPELLIFLAKKHKTVFFIGAKKEQLVQFKKALTSKTGIEVVGCHDGYFSQATEGSLLKEIKKQQPDLVLLAMGVPKQEEFLYRHRNELPAAVYMVVGGALHYLTGQKKRAPIWMRNLALEWLFRLVQEPVRLFWRYSVINLQFIFYTGQFYLTGKIKLRSR